MAIAVIKVVAGPKGWTVVGPNDQASKSFHRQQDARNLARRIVQDAGGGEIVIHSRSGRIADRQTVPGTSKEFLRSGSRRKRKIFSSR